MKANITVYYFADPEGVEQYDVNQWDIWTYFIAFKEKVPEFGDTGYIFSPNESVLQLGRITEADHVEEVPDLPDEIKSLFFEAVFER